MTVAVRPTDTRNSSDGFGRNVCKIQKNASVVLLAYLAFRVCLFVRVCLSVRLSVCSVNTRRGHCAKCINKQGLSSYRIESTALHRTDFRELQLSILIISLEGRNHVDRFLFPVFPFSDRLHPVVYFRRGFDATLTGSDRPPRPRKHRGTTCLR